MKVIAMPITFDEFPVPSDDDWRDATLKSLKGKPLEALNTQTYEGITLRPLYGQQDIDDLLLRHTLPGQVPFLRGVKASGYRQHPWYIAQQNRTSETASDYNANLRDALSRGQTAVVVDLSSDLAWWAQYRSKDVRAAFADVDLKTVPLYVRTHLNGLGMQPLLLASLDTAGMRGYIGDDIYALQTVCDAPLALEPMLDALAMAAAWTAENVPELDVILIRGDIYQDSGAHAAQELGFALASAVEHARALQARDVSLDTIFSQMSFLFAVGPNFFMEVAKLRAARMLWSQVVSAYGMDAAEYPAKLHVKSASWNKTRLDPYVNMLRTTTEGIAASVGGIESLELLPFDASYQQPDAFSERIARNQQVILQNEAHLTEVVDPAAGSYYVEWLTDQLAQRAWASFQEVEAAGGFAGAVAAGAPQAQIAQTRQQREERLAHRRDVLVGVNLFANVGESAAPADTSNGHDVPTNAPLLEFHGFEEALAAAREGMTISQLSMAMGVYHEMQSPSAYRAADPFQHLRDAASRYQQETGQLPGIFLVNMGTMVSYKARADFTRGFFEAGGFAVMDYGGFDTIGVAVKAAVESDMRAVVICSTDDLYRDVVEPVTKGIKAGKPDMLVILAGYPQEDVEAYQRAGVDAFIHLGADCLAINRWLQEQLNISTLGVIS